MAELLCWITLDCTNVPIEVTTMCILTGFIESLTFCKNPLDYLFSMIFSFQLLPWHRQLEDAGSSNLGQLLSRYITASTQQQLGSVDMNPSPGLSTHSPGSSGTKTYTFTKIL